MKMRYDFLIYLLAVGTLSACGTSTLQRLESGEAAVARMQSQRVDSQAFLKSAKMSIQTETRDAAWASTRESDLKATFTQTEGLKDASLTQADCRARGCLIEVDLQTGNDPAALVARREAATDWIARNQPCAYMVASEDATSSALTIVTQCENE
jgi:hypothetical protein